LRPGSARSVPMVRVMAYLVRTQAAMRPVAVMNGTTARLGTERQD
jgi:hypothetical protein